VGLRKLAGAAAPRAPLEANFPAALRCAQRGTAIRPPWLPLPSPRPPLPWIRLGERGPSDRHQPARGEPAERAARMSCGEPFVPVVFTHEVPFPLPARSPECGSCRNRPRRSTQASGEVVSGAERLADGSSVGGLGLRCRRLAGDTPSSLTSASHRFWSIAQSLDDRRAAHTVGTGEKLWPSYLDIVIRPWQDLAVDSVRRVPVASAILAGGRTCPTACLPAPQGSGCGNWDAP
jgi:hypothetical protein